jgi:hypothetical protein
VNICSEHFEVTWSGKVKYWPERMLYPSRSRPIKVMKGRVSKWDEDVESKDNGLRAYVS